MPTGKCEAFSRVLIDKALKFSGWNLLDRHEVQFKLNSESGPMRLLFTCAATLREGRVPVRVEVHRERLLSVKRGKLPGTKMDAWCKEIQRDYKRALSATKLSEHPDYQAANRLLINLRQAWAIWSN